MVEVADLLKNAVDVAKEIQASASSKKLADFLVAMEAEDAQNSMEELRLRVRSLAGRFPMPGISDDEMTALLAGEA